MIDRAEHFNATRADGAGPNPSRWTLFKREADSGSLDRLSVHVGPRLRPADGARRGRRNSSQRRSSTRSSIRRRRDGRDLIAETGAPARGGSPSATNIANLTGFPDLIVPAGFTGDNLPVGISFFGPAFSEPKLLALGYSFEQATHARRLPVHTPARPGESIPMP